MAAKVSFGERARAFFGSRLFFRLTVILFVLEASWIAFSARYPQAFDEQFHFGIIQVYSHHLSPFLSQQPAGADQYGALTRDPSYFYQYLMSFPLRLVTHLTSSFTAQIIALRLINVALLAASLPIFKKLLRLTSISEATNNVILAFMVLLPVFPLLGSQINYDNLFVPLSALAVYWCLQFVADVRDRHLWRWDKLARLAAVCFLTSVVKYPFLPIFLGIAICVVFAWWQARKRLHYEISKMQYRKLRLVLYGVALLVSLGLFVERDGINTIKYMTPVPGCSQVLTIQQCRSYAPWGRNYNIAQQHLHLAAWNVASFPFIWLYHMMGELVFTISSNFNDAGTVDYHTGAQTITLEVLTWAIFGVGMAAFLYRVRSLWRQPVPRMLLIICAIYIAALGAENLRDYIHLGEPLAIHGRYLFPILPLLLVLTWQALRETLAKLPFKRALLVSRGSALAAVLMVVLLVEGGGFGTYILRSQSSWFWPQSQPAQSINAHAQKLLKPFVLDINLQD